MTASPAQVSPDRTDDSLAELPEPLQVRCREIRKLLTDEIKRTVPARYRIGTIIKGIKRAPRRYGEHAIEKLADALALDPSSLYDRARVAEAFSPSDIDLLVRRKSKVHIPLSWSHLVVLSKLADAEVRDQLTEEALNQGFSVRQLKNRIEKLGESETPADAEDEVKEGLEGISTRVLNGLKELTALGRSWIDRSEELRTDAVEPLLTEVPKKPGKVFLEMLREARETQDRMRAACEKNVKELDRCLDAVQNRRR